MEQLPKRLEHDPIVDAIIEVRFETKMNPNVVFALIYGKVREKFDGKKVISLPISQIPPDIIRQDPALKHKPLYRIEGDDCSLQIGAQMIALSSRIPYIGWNRFSTMFYEIVNLCFEYFDKVSRLGLRYINFFEGDISNKININFSLSEKYEPRRLNIQTEVIVDNIPSTLQYTPNAVWQEKAGAVIDIDTFKSYKESSPGLYELFSDIEAVHKCEKKVFCSLLKDHFLQELGPQF